MDDTSEDTTQHISWDVDHVVKQMLRNLTQWKSETSS
jgi:hypothetical protein